MKTLIKKTPHCVDLEMRVIATLVNLGDRNDTRVQDAFLNLDIDCFYSVHTREMFDIISELFREEKDFSIASFIQHIPNAVFTNMDVLIKDYYNSPGMLETDVQTLNDYKTFRNQLRVLENSIIEANESLTPDKSLRVISDNIQRLNDTFTNKKERMSLNYAEIADNYLSNAHEDNAEFSVDIPGLPNVPNKSLITVAGRSGHGKTFWGLHLMDKIIDANPGKHNLYFNLEMQEIVMVERHAKLLGFKAQTRHELIEKSLPTLVQKNVNIISKPLITIEEIESLSRLASLKNPLSVIVVDYLGLIRTKAKSEHKHQEQSEITKRLAALAIELNCVVIALIQVNRDYKQRPVGSRCPKPEDAAESMGSVHSSTWWLGIDQPSHDSDDPQWRHMFQVECGKNRGESGMFKLRLEFIDGQFLPWKKPFSAQFTKKPALVKF